MKETLKDLTTCVTISCYEREWDADPDRGEAAGERWLILLPSKWNPSTHKQVYSWRYDPVELGATEARAPDTRRANMRPAMDDE